MKIVPIGNFPLLQNHFPAYFVIVFSVFRNFVGLSGYLCVFSFQWINLLMDCAYFGIVTWVCSQYPCQSEFINLSFSALLSNVINLVHAWSYISTRWPNSMFRAEVRQIPESENSDRKVQVRNMVSFSV